MWPLGVMRSDAALRVLLCCVSLRMSPHHTTPLLLFSTSKHTQHAQHSPQIMYHIQLYCKHATHGAQHSRSTHAALTQHSRSTHAALTQHSRSNHAALTQHSRRLNTNIILHHIIPNISPSTSSPLSSPFLLPFQTQIIFIQLLVMSSLPAP